MSAALAKARHSIILLGWGFDPRTRLHPDGFEGPDDPDEIGHVLIRLAKARPELDIRLLIWKSALRSLEATLGKKSAEDRPLDKRNTMIVGSEGLAVSLAHGVKRRNGLVSVCSGDDVEAQKIAQSCDLRYVPSAKLYETLVDVVVLTTNSMDYGSKKSPLNPSLLRENMAFMDLSELPGESKFTEEARARGCRVVEPAEIFADYIGLLFKSLTGKDIPGDAIAQGLTE